MCCIRVTILTEILAYVVTEPEMSGVGGVHLHATPSAPVTLLRELCVDISVGKGGDLVSPNSYRVGTHLLGWLMR